MPLNPMPLNLSQVLATPETQTILLFGLGLVVLIILVWLWKSIAAKIRLHRSLRLVFLEVRVPRYADEKNTQDDGKKGMKEVVSVMQQFFAVLHASIPKKTSDWVAGQHSLGVEMVAKEGELRFYFVIPCNLQYLLEKQITGYYPDAVVERVSDPNIFAENTKVAAGYFAFKKENFYPLRTFQKFEYDPLNNLTNAFSKISEKEGGTLQILFSPAHDSWRKNGKKRAREIFEGKKKENIPLLLRFLKVFFQLITLQLTSVTEKEGDKKEHKVTPQEEEQVKAIEAKSAEVGFSCIIRLISAAPTFPRAEANLQTISSAFTQFTEPNLNELKFKTPGGFRRKAKIRNIVENYLFRYIHQQRGNIILNPEELASIFHLPYPKYNTAPVIKWQNARVAPPPPNLPSEGIILGLNTFRGMTQTIRMTHEDRFRHFYIIGQTGTGKSAGALIPMIVQDMQAGHGLCVMDPHGSLAKEVMEFIPRQRAEDVIYFNPADTTRPMGMNLLEAKTVEEKDLVTLDALNIMLKLFGEEIFSPRLQDYFRNGVLTLMDDEEEGGSIVDVVSLFTNIPFQKYKRTKVKNPIVKGWWNDTYDSMGDNEKQEIIPYFASKFGAFITSTTMRNIIGQTKSAFDFGKAMQEGKIILVNLSKGMMGDLNSNLLGMIIVSKIQMAAMRREAISKEERRDFFFYIDEFQNFITESIESILSEARKYRLGMIMAHQYISQLEESGTHGTSNKIKKAVFGNVGSLWSYKVSAEDAEFLEKEFSPVFTQRDLNNLDKLNACVKLTINDVQVPPFSLSARKFWELKEFQKNPAKITEAIIELSRLQWGRDKKYVDAEILGRLGL